MTTAAGNFPFTYRGENEVLLGCFPEKLLILSYGRHRDGFSVKSDVLKHRSVLTYFPCIVREEPDIKRDKLKVRKKIFKKAVLKHIEGCATMSDIQSTYDMSDKNETNRRICKTTLRQRQQLLDAEIISVDYAALR